MCGEFGVGPYVPGFDEFLVDVLSMFDRHTWSWAYWSNDWGGWSPLEGTREETPILPYLVRTYPRATSGSLLSFDLDWATMKFTMEYISEDTGMPTEIFIPERHYPTGWEIDVSGTDNWNQEYDQQMQLLKLYVNEEGKSIRVKIKPK